MSGRKVSLDTHHFSMVLAKIYRWAKWLWLQEEIKFLGNVFPNDAKPKMIHLGQWIHSHTCSVSPVMERECPCTVLLGGSADVLPVTGRQRAGPRDLGLRPKSL